MKFGLDLRASLSQTLTPQQIQYLKLLQLPLTQLEQQVRQEIEMNPMLEDPDDFSIVDDVEYSSEGSGIEETYASRNSESASYEDYHEDFESMTPQQLVDDKPEPFEFHKMLWDGNDDYGVKLNSSGDDDDNEPFQIKDNSSFLDDLIGQLRMMRLTPTELMLGENIVGNIDTDGYLRRELIEIVNETNEEIAEHNFIKLLGFENLETALESGVKLKHNPILNGLNKEVQNGKSNNGINGTNGTHTNGLNGSNNGIINGSNGFNSNGNGKTGNVIYGKSIGSSNGNPNGLNTPTNGNGVHAYGYTNGANNGTNGTNGTSEAKPTNGKVHINGFFKNGTFVANTSTPAPNPISSPINGTNGTNGINGIKSNDLNDYYKSMIEEEFGSSYDEDEEEDSFDNFGTADYFSLNKPKPNGGGSAVLERNPARSYSLSQESANVLTKVYSKNPEFFNNIDPNLVKELANKKNFDFKPLPAVTLEDSERILGVIQQLDPAGVGSRSIQECLVSQCKAFSSPNAEQKLALEILSNHYELFAKKHYQIITKQLNITEDFLKSSLEVIRRLNPRPGGGNFIAEINTVIPDFVIEKDEDSDELLISVNDTRIPTLKLSRAYESMKKEAKYKLYNKETREWIRNKYEDAKFLIQALRQRKNTMLKVMTAIAGLQKDFFTQGPSSLKPLIYKNVSDDTGLDISTVCRIVNGKYVQTGFGTFELKYFFSESLPSDDGEEVSTRVIKQILKEVIDAEDKDKPESDEKLSDILKERGYNVARRTIAKYREQMKIPVARLRREL